MSGASFDEARLRKASNACPAPRGRVAPPGMPLVGAAEVPNLSREVCRVLKKWVSCVVVMWAWALSACGGGEAEKQPAATEPVWVAIAPLAAAVEVGGAVQLSATVKGSTAAGVTWSVAEPDGGAVNASGLYTAPAIPGTFHVIATSTADPTRTAGAEISVSAAAPTVAVSIEPSSGAAQVGGTLQLAALLTGTSDPAVAWAIVEPDGGSISDAGLYTAPNLPGTYHVTATSRADPTKVARAPITVSAAVPAVSVGVIPRTAAIYAGQRKQFRPNIVIDGRLTDVPVLWSVAEAGGGSVSDSGLYIAPSVPGVYHVVATMQADPTKNGTAEVTVSARPLAISVAVVPAEVSIPAGTQKLFVADVKGATDQSVTWSVVEPDGGSVSDSGLYTAPNMPGVYHVMATSNADTSKSATAAVAVIPSDSATPPSAPQGLIASAAIGGVSLVWDPSDGATAYNVYRYALQPRVFRSTSDLTRSTPGLEKLGDPPTTASYVDHTATMGVDYLYLVTAWNAAGESGFSQHSCGASAAQDPKNQSLPPVRPRVFMAAHGSNLVMAKGAADPIQDPTQDEINLSVNAKPDLLQSSLEDWAYVATCLDGIWGNYNKVYPKGPAPLGGPSNHVDQLRLFNLINTRNVHVELDLLTSPIDLPLVGNDMITGPQKSGVPGPDNVVLNREAISLYIPAPRLWEGFSIAQARAEYVAKPGAEPWKLFKDVYYGTSVREWGSPHLGKQIFSTASSLAGFEDAGGVFVECGKECTINATIDGFCKTPDCEAMSFRQGYVNAIVKSHLAGKRFITFYSSPGNLNQLGPFTTGWLQAMQKAYRFALNMQCSGTYDPVTGNYYPSGGYYQPNGTYDPYPPQFATSGPNLSTWNLCEGGRTKGLFKRGDMVLVINYNGYYPPVPEYQTSPSGGAVGQPADSVTGMLNWLLHQ